MMPGQGSMENDSTHDAAYVTVSTEQAVYMQHPGNHTAPSPISAETVETVDAVVLENGTEPFEDVSLDWLREQVQYQELVDQCADAETPIFLVDVPYPGSETRLYLSEVANLGLPCAAGITGLLHGHAALGLLTLPAFAFSLGGSSRSPTVNRAAGYLQLSNAYTWNGFRSAVAAEKLETIVTPQLAEHRDIPPVILVEYGAGHLDIGTYLRHPQLRRQVIRTHQRVFSRNIPSKALEQVAAFHFDTESTEKHIHETLPDPASL